MTTASSSGLNAVELATDLTIAWLGNPNTRASADNVPTFLVAMRDSLMQLIPPPDAASAEDALSDVFTPAVSVRKSLASKEHIISMIDGKPYKTLRRHLNGHGLTTEEYRRRYNLKADYPMVAEAYSAARREIAQKIGLGRKSGSRTAPAHSSPPKRQKLKLPTVTG